MRHCGRSSLRRIHILGAFGLYGVWTGATYLLEGRLPFKGRVFKQQDAAHEFLSVSYLYNSAATALI
jgi:hypothetical protein